jgi:hypothetical protein
MVRMVLPAACINCKLAAEDVWQPACCAAGKTIRVGLARDAYPVPKGGRGAHAQHALALEVRLDLFGTAGDSAASALLPCTDTERQMRGTG